MSTVKTNITNHQSFLSFLIQCFAVIFLFLFCSFVFNAGWIFTEWSFFVQFFRSMLVSKDFNIIEQVGPAQAWLVTKNFYHPSIHPESQLGLMFPLYIFEFISSTVNALKRDYRLEFALTGFLMNMFSIFVGFQFNKKSAEILKIKFGFPEAIIFYFGCPILLFSLFQATVVEIAAFPLLSYLVFVCLNCKLERFPSSPVAPGIVIGFLFITKITFWPVAALTAIILTSHFVRNRQWGKLSTLCSIVSLLVLANSLNMWVKYGYLSNVGPPLELFVDLSASNIWANLLGGFFPKGGLFFASPIYGFSSLGLLIFLATSFKKKFLNAYEVLFVLAWFVFIFFHYVILMGYIVEDHLPGRIHLAAAPLLVLGFAYLKHRLSAVSRIIVNLILVSSVLWHLLITFFYFNVIQVGSFYYPTNMIPSADLFAKAFPLYSQVVKSNFIFFQSNWVHIFTFTLIVSVFLACIRNHLYRPALLKSFAVICLISFLGMSACNLIFHQKNIQWMKAQGIFDGKVVGNGPEIYAIDYILDFAKAASSRNNPAVNEKIKKILDEYYQKVEKQVLISSPALDKAIKERSADFSFSIHHEESKEHPKKNKKIDN